jgi:hypothetical protein
VANEGFAGDATLRPARWRRDAQSLTRRRGRSRESGDGLKEKPSTDRSSGQLLRRGQDAPKAKWPQAIRAIVWTRKCPVRTPGKIDKPLWAPTFGGPAETKKARSVVASSRVPRLAGFAGSPPAAGLPGAVNWPLVQIPADRHTTTGTCVLGKETIWANRALAQGVFSPAPDNFAEALQHPCELPGSCWDERGVEPSGKCLSASAARRFASRIERGSLSRK